MSARFSFIALSAFALTLGGIAQAGGVQATARAAMDLFAQHCFSPFMTADKAARAFALTGAAYDFYDLDPFSGAALSPATGRAVTPGTDRRCEITFRGEHGDAATNAALSALAAQGITDPAPLPARYVQDNDTTLLAARYLNPNRIAIVHIGTRSGSSGLETFMLVERLTPSNSSD